MHGVGNKRCIQFRSELPSWSALSQVTVCIGRVQEKNHHNEARDQNQKRVKDNLAPQRFPRPHVVVPILRAAADSHCEKRNTDKHDREQRVNNPRHRNERGGDGEKCDENQHSAVT